MDSGLDGIAINVAGRDEISWRSLDSVLFRKFMSLFPNRFW